MGQTIIPISSLGDDLSVGEGGLVDVSLVEQLGAVDVQRLGRRVGRLTAEEMWSVDDALVVLLGLD